MKYSRLAAPAVLILLAAMPLTFNSAAAGSPAAISGIDVDRLAGPDRFSTAVAVSQRYYPTSGVPVVYVADGLNFPDALSAAPAAAHQGGPLLIVQPNSLPPVMAAELDRLAPQKIVVV